MSPEITDSLASRVLCHSHFKEVQRPPWPKPVRVHMNLSCKHFCFRSVCFPGLTLDTKFDVNAGFSYARIPNIFRESSATKLLLFKRVLEFD